jgi:hypothetical protein
MNEDTEIIARRIREASETVHAPQRLHRTVAAERERRAPSYRRRLLLTGGGLAGTLAAVVVALVLVLSPAGAPSLDEAVALALQTPTAAAPKVDPSDPGLLQTSVGGVSFPTYPHWQATGSRTDEVGGRRAVTVAYRSDGKTVNYTIVDGEPLDVPREARSRSYEGFQFSVVPNADHRVITWEKDGRTCILAGSPGDVTALIHDAMA